MHPAGAALRRRHVDRDRHVGGAEAQRQGVGTALMQAICDYADRWMGVLRIELTVYVDNARGDRALPQVRLRDRGPPPRLCAARRPLCRCLGDGAPASRAAGLGARRAAASRHDGVAPAPSRSCWRWLSRWRGGAGARLLSELRRRRQRAGRCCAATSSPPRRAPAPAIAMFHGCGGAYDKSGAAAAAHARVRRALQRPRHARARRRLADAALREGALHAAQRQAPRDAGEPPARRARRDRLPRRSRRRRRQAHRHDRLVERRQHGARRPPTCTTTTSPPAPSSRPSRSPSIPAARATSSAATRRRRRS